MPWQDKLLCRNHYTTSRNFSPKTARALDQRFVRMRHGYAAGDVSAARSVLAMGGWTITTAQGFFRSWRFRDDIVTVSLRSRRFFPTVNR
jgi:hypothetical protein